MKTSSIGIFEAKTHLSDILKKVQQGERFLITNRGEPVAELSPVGPKKNHLQRGGARNEGYYCAPDFDAPIDDLDGYM